MTLLPEIIREAKIVSGKDQPTFMQKSKKKGQESTATDGETFASSSVIVVSGNDKDEAKNAKTSGNEPENFVSASNNSMTQAPPRKRTSRSHHRITVAETLTQVHATSDADGKGEKASLFPSLILNDKNRSTAYQRPPRSSDFANVKNSPTATRLIYNWKVVLLLSSLSFRTRQVNLDSLLTGCGQADEQNRTSQS